MPVDEPATVAVESLDNETPPSADDDNAALVAPGPAVGEPAAVEIPFVPDNGPVEMPDDSVDVPEDAPRHEAAVTTDGEGDESTDLTDGPTETSGSAEMDALRDVHERRLHGFALLVTLGNRTVAADLTRAALRDAEEKLDELGHPERAAVWLRRHVLRHAPKRTESGGRGPFRRSRPAPHEPGGITEIGADDVLVEALARLDLQARAALILQDVERLREVDVADALGTDLRALERLLRDARTKYSQAYTAAAARHGVGDSLALPEEVRRSADSGLPRHE